jgi:hypothetical protein
LSDVSADDYDCRMKLAEKLRDPDGYTTRLFDYRSVTK